LRLRDLRRDRFLSILVSRFNQKQNTFHSGTVNRDRKTSPGWSQIEPPCQIPNSKVIFNESYRDTRSRLTTLPGPLNWSAKQQLFSFILPKYNSDIEEEEEEEETRRNRPQNK